MGLSPKVPFRAAVRKPMAIAVPEAASSAPRQPLPQPLVSERVAGAGLQVAFEGEGGGFGAEGHVALQARWAVFGGGRGATPVVIRDALAKVGGETDVAAAGEDSDTRQ